MADDLTINYSFIQPELAVPGHGPKLRETIVMIDAAIFARQQENEAQDLTLAF